MYLDTSCHTSPHDRSDRYTAALAFAPLLPNWRLCPFQADLGQSTKGIFVTCSHFKRLHEVNAPGSSGSRWVKIMQKRCRHVGVLDAWWLLEIHSFHSLFFYCGDFPQCAVRGGCSLSQKKGSLFHLAWGCMSENGWFSYSSSARPSVSLRSVRATNSM